MNKYPYIGRLQKNITLFTGVNSGFVIENVNEDFLTYSEKWGESFFDNITHEYLQNTCGEVVSPEHAEFIIKLAESAGLDIGTYSENRDTYFYTDDDYIGFADSEELAGNRNEKQITIPLPPKADNKECIRHAITKCIRRIDGCEDFELCGVDSNGCAANLSVSFNGNDEMIKAESVNQPKTDKQESSGWMPKVGDEVEFTSGKGTLVVRKPDDQGIVIVESFDSELGSAYKRVPLKALKKPKTPEEELRDDIVWLTIKHMENKSFPIESNAYYLFSDLMGKYNITKKV